MNPSLILFKVKMKITSIFWEHFYHIYRLTIPHRVKSLQSKEVIKVLFVLAELSTWKTEELFRAMLKHPRFNPILGLTTSYESPGSKPVFENYLHQKGYIYIDLDSSKDSIDNISPDIIFYYKPYSNSIPAQHNYRHHIKSLFCYIDYCFVIENTFVHLFHEIIDYSWLTFVENNLVKEAKDLMLGNHIKNCVVTGIPMQDVLSKPKDCFNSPWKCGNEKKKIIYAPHHSIPGTNGEGIEYATFLEYGEYILELAKQYSDQIHIAFKPHPNLHGKLVKIWGQSKTDEYYNAWETMPNTQIERGEYIGLFKYSDAMIHDSSSFIEEYQYTHNPVGFLETTPMKTDELNKSGLVAFNMHYRLYNKKQIKDFIENVIKGYDPLKEERENLFRTIAPKGCACTNIINTILGK